jgi:hypothetical protein
LSLGEIVVENFVDNEALTGVEVYVSPPFHLLIDKSLKYFPFRFNDLRRSALNMPRGNAPWQSLCITAPDRCMKHLAAQQKLHEKHEKWT